jgi:hypothetical protein
MLKVVPARSKRHGSTYGQWAAKWWKWYFSIPKSKHPALDLTGKNSTQNQRGAVWFLAGTPDGKNTAERKSKIPAGKSVFFPVITNECSIREGHGKNHSELRRRNKKNIDEVKRKSLTIDDETVNLKRHRVQSSPFRLNFSKNNILGQPVGSTTSVCDGYWILSEPLEKGSKSVIKFSGMAHCKETCEDFVTDVTYVIEAA